MTVNSSHSPMPESFRLDHESVEAPYVRKAGEVSLQGGGRVVKWDVRFKQPNRSSLPMPVVHSVEHMLATTLRAHSDDVIDISPMGCQTGFYVSVDGATLSDFDDFTELLARGLVLAIELEEVPGASVVECGWAESHDLRGAQKAMDEFLAVRNAWADVFGSDAS